MLQDWSVITFQALQGLWQGFLEFIPTLIGAIVIFIVGWFIAIFVGQIVTKLLDLLRVNQLFAKSQWDEALAKAGIKANVTGFIGAVIKWVLVLVFLSSSAKILNLPEFTDFLSGVIEYLPNVVIAALIFVATVIVADIIEKAVRVTTERVKVGYGEVISATVKWSIWVFSIMAILYQLGVARPFMETLFTGIIGMMVIAVGISFGLGGKDVASGILQDLKKKLKE